MKKTSIFFAALCISVSMYAVTPRVLSDREVGKGYYPHMTSAMTMEYIDEENATYDEATPQTGLAVDNEDLCLNLYRNGQKTCLYPDGTGVNYIWSSLSPDQTMIVYNTRRGTSVCDLNGHVIKYLGHLNAPVWYGNDKIVGMHDTSDGHEYTGSSIALFDLTTGKETELVSADRFAMYPSVHAASGRVAYNTLDGKLHLMQLNLSEEPLRQDLPQLRKVENNRLYRQADAPARNAAKSLIQPSQMKIYINPGHGGHWSNDRNMTIYPYTSGDTLGFWESNSNLDKGLALDSMLHVFGVQTKMSRTLNRNGGGNDADLLATKLSQGTITQAEYDDMLANGDDRSLSAIVAESNAYKPNFMISIHSNAGGPANYVLELYAGIDPDDPQRSYPTPTPCSDEGREVSTIIGNNLQSNTLTPWTTEAPSIRGDKTFGRTAMHWSNGYGVLRGLTTAGVISEGSMHDYIPETYRLMNMDYKMQQAWYFTKAFLEYYCGSGWANGVIGGQLRDANNKQLFPNITRIRKTDDELEPLCGATVQLLQGDQVLKTYTTDELYNGLFFFWNLTPGQYTIRASKEHYYTQDVPVTVTANNMTLQTVKMNMCRETRPEVISYSPCPAVITDSVEVSSQIVLNFNWDMLEQPTQDAFSISPAVEGKLEFSNSQKTLTFTPNEALEPGVEYTVTLATTACHPDTQYPNTLAEPFTFSFRTRNRAGLQLIQAYPANGATEVDLNPTVMLIFDAKLASAVKSQIGNDIEITAEGGFSFVPSSRKTTINTVPAPYGSARFDVNTTLAPNTTYTMTIKDGMKDENSVHVLNPIAITFTTGSGEKPTYEGELLNNLDALFFAMNTDKSAGVASKSIMMNNSIYNEGKASNKVAYSFKEGEPDEMVALEPTEFYSFYSTNSFSMDVFGDLSYNDIYLEFQTEGDVHTIYLGTLDYVGWKHLSVNLSELPESVEFQLSAIKIVRTANILSAKGEIYLDRMMRGTIATGLENGKWRKENGGWTKHLHRGNVVIDNGARRYGIAGEERP